MCTCQSAKQNDPRAHTPVLLSRDFTQGHLVPPGGQGQIRSDSDELMKEPQFTHTPSTAASEKEGEGRRSWKDRGQHRRCVHCCSRARGRASGSRTCTGPKTSQLHSLTVPEAGSPKSGCRPGHPPPQEAPGADPASCPRARWPHVSLQPCCLHGTPSSDRWFQVPP